MKPIRNIGIFAHVDAGKTTLSERILSHAGAIRESGSVDAGTAHTDTLSVERRRGISVKATCVGFDYGGTRIHLIDTPGHVDFSAEIERSAWALDAGVIVVCCVSGVQPQTEVLFHALRQEKIPVIFFLNKTDRAGADPEAVYAQLRRLLSDRCAAVDDEEGAAEILCDADEALMEQYLMGGEFPVLENLHRLAKRGEIFPVLRGSALKDEGIEKLMEAIVSCFPAPGDVGQLSGVAFAAHQHKSLGRGLWIRLYGGTLENRCTVTLPDGMDPLTGEPKSLQSKITQICDPSGNPVGRLAAGEIGIVYGLGDAPIGTILGNPEAIPRRIEPGSLRTPLITVQVIPEKAEQMTALRRACDVLAGEDPLLQVQYIRTLDQLHLSVMGTIQLEILQELLQTRFDLNVTFSPPAIIYRETVAQSCEGYVAYLAPKPCWAILKFEIKPAPRGSGVTFRSTVPVRTIQARYQNQVAQAIPLALSQGRLGWQVTDVEITLVDGGEHKFHTHPLDFIVATPMAIQDGLQRGGNVLLEPILHARFLLPSDCVGKVMTDVNTMRGQVLDSFADGDRMILNALIPVKDSLDYAVTLAAQTGGRGAMSAKLHGYRECPMELGATTPRRSVDPLDTSKYILAARSALEGGIFQY